MRTLKTFIFVLGFITTNSLLAQDYKSIMDSVQRQINGIENIEQLSFIKHVQFELDTVSSSAWILMKRNPLDTVTGYQYFIKYSLGALFNPEFHSIYDGKTLVDLNYEIKSAKVLNVETSLTNRSSAKMRTGFQHSIPGTIELFRLLNQIDTLMNVQMTTDAEHQERFLVQYLCKTTCTKESCFRINSNYFLWIDKKTYLPVKIIITNVFTNEYTEVTFSNVIINKKTDPYISPIKSIPEDFNIN